MAAVPQGAFATKKVRRNEEKRKEFHCKLFSTLNKISIYKYNPLGTTELNPMNYSSKYMNSIWGQYNRYSVHNLKKIMDNTVISMSAGLEKRFTSFETKEIFS